MSASCRWCGHRSFSYDGHECDGVRLSREHAELRAAVKEVLDACDAVSATFGEGEEEMTVYADAMAHLRKVLG